MNWLNSLIEKLLSVIPRLNFVLPDELGVRITMGKHIKSLVPGYYMVWPLIQEIQVITVTPQVVDARCQSVRTIDGTDMAVGLAIRYRITNVASALLKVLNYDQSLQNSALVACAEYFGNIDIGDLHVDDINTKLTDLIQKKARGWGIEIQAVGVTDIGNTTNIRVLGDIPIIPLLENEE